MGTISGPPRYPKMAYPHLSGFGPQKMAHSWISPCSGQYHYATLRSSKHNIYKYVFSKTHFLNSADREISVFGKILKMGS